MYNSNTGESRKGMSDYHAVKKHQKIKLNFV